MVRIKILSECGYEIGSREVDSDCWNDECIEELKGIIFEDGDEIHIHIDSEEDEDY